MENIKTLHNYLHILKIAFGELLHHGTGTIFLQILTKSLLNVSNILLMLQALLVLFILSCSEGS
jgi:hypothetical protein